MRADKILTVMAVVATAAATLAAVPAADAQSPAQAHHHHHAPARVTVHKRTFLDPGTETKTHGEHYSDYFYSPSHGLDPMQNSTLFNSGPGLPLVHDGMPFPNCLDLPGRC